MIKKSKRKRIVFSVSAPDATEVFLTGNFNEWVPNARQMKKSNGGEWKTTMLLEEGEYEYRFVVDGEWRDDPRCTERRANEYGSENCVIRL